MFNAVVNQLPQSLQNKVSASLDPARKALEQAMASIHDLNSPRRLAISLQLALTVGGYFISDNLNDPAEAVGVLPDKPVDRSIVFFLLLFVFVGRVLIEYPNLLHVFDGLLRYSEIDQPVQNQETRLVNTYLRPQILPPSVFFSDSEYSVKAPEITLLSEKSFNHLREQIKKGDESAQQELDRFGLTVVSSR